MNKFADLLTALICTALLLALALSYFDILVK